MSGVLIVDDDPAIREGLKMLLGNEGIDAWSTDSPFELPFVVRRIDPDVILVDLAMPSISGEAILRVLDRRSLKTNAALLIFSGRDPRALAKLADELNVDGFISKAEAPEEVLRKIQFWIQQKQPRNEKGAAS